MFTGIICLVVGLLVGGALGTVFGLKWEAEAHELDVKVRDDLIAARDKIIAVLKDHVEGEPAAAAPAAPPAPATTDLPPEPELRASAQQ